MEPLAPKQPVITRLVNRLQAELVTDYGYSSLIAITVAR